MQLSSFLDTLVITFQKKRHFENPVSLDIHGFMALFLLQKFNKISQRKRDENYVEF